MGVSTLQDPSPSIKHEKSVLDDELFPYDPEHFETPPPTPPEGEVEWYTPLNAPLKAVDAVTSIMMSKKQHIVEARYLIASAWAVLDNMRM